MSDSEQPTTSPSQPPPPASIQTNNASTKSAPIHKWLKLILAAIFGVSLALNLLFFIIFISLTWIALSHTDDPLSRYQEILVDGDKEANDKIAIIDIHGFISSFGDNNMVEHVRSLLKILKKDENVKAIILDIDSPGGGVTASDIIYNELSHFKTSKNLPIIALFGDVAASGGYYIAMASNQIIARPTSITGSIGVISELVNVHNLFTKLGIKINVIKSPNSQGKESFKDLGSPYRPMKPEEKKILQSIINEMWNRFIHVVDQGRPNLTLKQVKALADGKVYTAVQAQKKGLIDHIGYRDDAFKIARKLSHTGTDTKIVRYKKTFSLEDLFTSRSSLPLPKAMDIINRAPYNSPHLLYLWTVH